MLRIDSCLNVPSEISSVRVPLIVGVIIDVYSFRGYSEDVKQHRLHFYAEGNGFRVIWRFF